MTVTIDRLDCGTLTAAAAMFETGGSDVPVTVPVPAWLIRHPRGNVLFDCGMHPDLTAPGPLLELVSLFFDVGIGEHQVISGALEASRTAPDDIDVVVLSHLHFDHAGGLVELPNARLVVQDVEWQAGFDSDLQAANSFRRDDYDLGHDVVVADGEHDLFGDGLVVCVPTPGHTPGHQSLRVRLADREVVLCGDCAYFERTLDGGPLPPISHDLVTQAESLATLRAMRARGATLVPGHDAAAFALLPSRLA
jgi:glyoxylase-like metal-dependent hydrolase (beta-lactamase superfamily II)